MNWDDIRAEYIGTKIGYRELAKKHGVSFGVLQRKAKQENWPGARETVKDTTMTEVIAAVKATSVDRALRVQQAADLLLEKIELTLENIDGKRSSKAVKDCADALKSVMDIMMIRSEKDKEEQELRIAKLRKDTEADNKKPEVIVSFKGEAERWSN